MKGFEVGDKIRRKQHKKKTRLSSHPIVEIINFYPIDSGKKREHMTTLRDTSGKDSYMMVAGLDWYEKIDD